MIDEHLAAFEYDWRTRFGIPLSRIGGSMSWGEAVRMAVVLCGDPSSMVSAAMSKWKHPMSREAMLAADQFDLAYMKAAGRKAVKYPRPWDREASNVRRLGNAAGRSRAEVAAILNQFGHSLPV